MPFMKCITLLLFLIKTCPYLRCNLSANCCLVIFPWYCLVHINLPFSSNEIISVLMEWNCWIGSQLTTLNTFQKPAYHCQLSSYQLTFQEEGNMSPSSGNISQLPFEQTELKPFTVYTWKLVHNNYKIFHFYVHWIFEQNILALHGLDLI